MHTELGEGEGECRIGSFSVDFHEDQMYLAGQAYPKGYFANEILNIGGKKVAQLLRCAAPAIRLRNDLLENRFDPAMFEQFDDSICLVKSILHKQMPFCLMDWNTENAHVANALSQRVKRAVSAYYEAQNKGKLPEKYDALFHKFYMSVLDFYVCAPTDIACFRLKLVQLEEKLRNLDVRDAPHFAAVVEEFFEQPMQHSTRLSSCDQNTMSGFTLEPNIRQEYVTLTNLRNQKIGRRLHFTRLMDFLVTDFFEGLQVGHAPKKCAVCGRYFLTTNARPRKYCDGYAPDDPRGRSCQQVGARKQRAERERADDHPVKIVCEKRCNTIDHHLRQGKIDKEFAKKAKALARNKRDKALRDNGYYTSEYENEMTQEAIYAQTQQLLGRPPTIQNANE